MSIDICILVLILVSVIISVVRGFFKEAVNLLTWLAAILLTLMYTSRFATLLPRDTIESPQARYAISAIILFFGSLFVGGVISYLLQKILANSAKTKADFWLGMLFGAIRGLVIATLLVLLANLIPSFKQENWWRTSVFIPRLQVAAQAIHAQLPREIAQHFDFSPANS